MPAHPPPNPPLLLLFLLPATYDTHEPMACPVNGPCIVATIPRHSLLALEGGGVCTRQPRGRFLSPSVCDCACRVLFLLPLSSRATHAHGEITTTTTTTTTTTDCSGCNTRNVAAVGCIPYSALHRWRPGLLVLISLFLCAPRRRRFWTVLRNATVAPNRRHGPYRPSEIVGGATPMESSPRAK
ncbi:hypothetical protein LY78DRAFT_316233 [Colletotrichum sublineola]|nr:hypothetical protein LY78DRAFT_316233 [Colletotrichum sublineola]